MHFPQTGIFALGDAAHLFLEFSKAPGSPARALVEAGASFHEPRTTVGGLNLVIGFRPELWRELAPEDTPLDAHGFDAPVAGPDGFIMPATQSDLWLWMAAASYDIVWDAGRKVMAELAPIATLDRQLSGWAYKHSRDLTGFEDGTENPSLMEAPDIAIVPSDRAGAGSSILLFQKWSHQESWNALSDAQQERAMGRTKRDSIELEGNLAADDSHVARAKDVVDGIELDIFRRNVPYGDVVDYGTVFVGFSCEQSRLQRMLDRMAGCEDGVRDAITRYTTPLTGAYYVIPSIAALARFAAKTG